jgi:hypothetical protein
VAGATATVGTTTAISKFLLTLFNVASTDRFAAAVAPVTFTLNTADEAPPATTTEVGLSTVTGCVLVCPSETLAPPAGAFSVSPTVHTAVSPMRKLAGAQVKLLTRATKGMLTTPPVATTVSASPVGVAPPELTTPTAAVGLDVDAATVRTALARMPSWMAVLFIPLSKQEYRPLVTGRHCSVLPACVAAGPAVICTPLKSAVENVKVHSRLETEPPSAAHDKGNVTAPAGGAEPVPSCKEEACISDAQDINIRKTKSNLRVRSVISFAFDGVHLRRSHNARPGGGSGLGRGPRNPHVSRAALRISPA